MTDFASRLAEYQSHKRVRAGVIIDLLVAGRVDSPEDMVSVRLVADDGDVLDVNVNRQVFARGLPTAGDMFIVYPDGYQSWSPAQAFADGYLRIVPGETADMTDEQKTFFKAGRLVGETASRVEIARLTQWVSDLQSAMYVNCVYCGHRYGPDGETPVAMADVLTQHVAACPSHPLAAANDEIVKLKASLSWERARCASFTAI